MNKLISSLLLLLASLTTAHAADLEISKFRAVWSTRFNSTAEITDGYTLLPGTRWIDHAPTGDFGDAYWKFTSFSTDPVYGLLIKASKNPANGSWEAGGLSSCDANGNGFAQQYGYFEAYMKVPGGMGTWPAFWLFQKFGGPNSPPNPKTEIDVMEFYGGWLQNYHTVWHLWEAPGGSRTGELDVATGIDLSTSFHRYGVEVAPDFITWYLDRKQKFQVPTRDPIRGDLAQYPMCVLVNYALGSGWPLTGVGNPSYLAVREVKVYKRKIP